MGNKASVLWGAGPQNVSPDSEEHGDGGGTAVGQRGLGADDIRSSSDTTPVALSAEEQADAKRYSELFGGKPKVKSAGAPSSKAKTGSRQQQQQQQKKKKQRFDTSNGFDGKDVGAGQGVSGGDGDDSAPGSPYRGKAAWAAGTAAEGNGKGDECAPLPVSEEERRRQVMEAVSAKIEDLEKSKDGNDGGRGADEAGAGGTNVVEQEEGALVPAGPKGSAGEAVRARAAVANALFAGVPQNTPASNELLLGPSGASVKGGAVGAGVVADLPPATARTASHRPAPQRNFKLKN